MNTKILAATVAFLLGWVALKLWFAPPHDLLATMLMIGKGVALSVLFFLGVSWVADRLAKPQSTN